MTEREAITLMRQGDMRGLVVMIETYQLKAVRVAHLITRDRAMAEDVVQATFIRIYERIEQFDTSRSFAPYFMRSVTNASVQAVKKNQRTLSLDTQVVDDMTFEDMLTADTMKPAEELDAKEQQMMIKEALDKLSPEQRAVVVMRYFLDMSENDMAEELNTPKGTIKWRLHEARKRLRGFLHELVSANVKEVRRG